MFVQGSNELHPSRKSPSAEVGTIGRPELASGRWHRAVCNQAGCAHARRRPGGGSHTRHAIRRLTSDGAPPARPGEVPVAGAENLAPADASIPNGYAAARDADLGAMAAVADRP